jgi:hypothetical protein
MKALKHLSRSWIWQVFATAAILHWPPSLNAAPPETRPSWMPPESGMRLNAVPLEAFLRLQAGVDKSTVEKLLGNPGEHQFTHLDEDATTWQCVEYVVAQEPRFASVGFDLLFKNDKLYSIADSNEFWSHLKNLETARQKELAKGPRERKDDLIPYDDDHQIKEFFQLKSLRGDEIAKSMPDIKRRILAEEHDHQARDAANNPDWGLTAVYVAVSAMHPSMQSKTDALYKKNAEFIEKYDGNKLTIGMTKAQVEELFGQPLISDDLRDSAQAAIYGPSDREVISGAGYVACQPVLVLYWDDKSARVLSNMFFDPTWRNRVWPE